MEEMRRTKVIPHVIDEKCAMKLVFATLIRVTEVGAGCRSRSLSRWRSSCDETWARRRTKGGSRKAKGERSSVSRAATLTGDSELDLIAIF